jgi:hypothetical protein
MLLQERINSFIYLGQVLQEFSGKTGRSEINPGISQYNKELLLQAVENTQIENGWFNRDNIMFAIRAVAHNLNSENLESWMNPYKPALENITTTKTVAVIMAGNIPMVGFHDFLCVLLSGNKFLGKLSSDDKYLLPVLAEILTDFNSEWDLYIKFTQDKIHSFDSVIATGSNNSSNYFEFYFSKYPHIIRKNRNSMAILTGEETAEELSNLAQDVFLYFGLGCRNVSKIFIPEKYDFSLLIKAFSLYESLLDHHKYRNNYDYFKAIFQLNNVPFLDAKSVLLKEDITVSSPISVLNYQYYLNLDDLITELSGNNESIQCIICKNEVPFRWFQPGNAQTPELWDYADGIDTMKFLIEM